MKPTPKGRLLAFYRFLMSLSEGSSRVPLGFIYPFASVREPLTRLWPAMLRKRPPTAILQLSVTRFQPIFSCFGHIYLCFLSFGQHISLDCG